MIEMRDTLPEDLKQHRPGDYTGWEDPLLNMCRTLVDPEDNPLAVVGIRQRWEGVADIWAVFTDHAVGYGLPLVRACIFLLNDVQESFDLARLQAQVQADHLEYQRWAELCGFSQEAYHEGAGPGNADVITYVRWAPQAPLRGVAPRVRH